MLASLPGTEVPGKNRLSAGQKVFWAVLLLLPMYGMAGCATAQTSTTVTTTSQSQENDPLRELATKYIKSALKFDATPAVRAQALEAAASTRGDFQAQIRERLKDQHPGVRFAACMAVGKKRDAAAMPAIRELLKDPDANVRVGAYFALERLGDASNRSKWSDALLHSADPAVRRNAALALGQLEDPNVTSLLKRASNDDSDEGVRVQALEGLAMLGDDEAISHFMQDAFGGKGYRQPFGVLVLGEVKSERVLPPLRARLTNSPYVEAKLAAARGLGRHGSDLGYPLAIEMLVWEAPQQGVSEDTPQNQMMRVRTMAALALGDIGDPRALPALKTRMQTPDDPRVQLAAARAILMILDRQSPRPAPA